MLIAFFVIFSLYGPKHPVLTSESLLCLFLYCSAQILHICQALNFSLKPTLAILELIDFCLFLKSVAIIITTTCSDI